MKNKIIILFITIVILSLSYSIYSFTISWYKYKNLLQNKIESLEKINARIDNQISDSSNVLYYNLDYLENEFIKLDEFFLTFSTESIITKNIDIKKQLNILKYKFEEKDFLNYKFQKVNIILKNSTIYLASLLLKSQSLFIEPKYLSLINESISNIYLTKSSNDKDFLLKLNKNIMILKSYTFNSIAQEEFNTMLIAHLNVYNTQYSKYYLYKNRLADDIYTIKIENLKQMIYKNIDKKLSLVDIYLWIYVLLLLFSIITILYLIEKIQQQKIDILVQSKNAQLGDMIGNIAHQWRQPLSTISTAATGIQIRKEINNLSIEEENKILETINNNAQFLSKTIDIFRNYIQEKKELKEVILQDRIDISLNIIASTLEDNNIEVINKINYTKPIKIIMIVGELSQVIINLLNNSKDVIKEKNIDKGWVQIHLEEKDNRAILTIEDNGGGIPLSIMDKIFDPYFTTKHQSVGTGLGLHMSKDIIEKSLKGKLSVRNSENGAIFTIVLPLV